MPSAATTAWSAVRSAVAPLLAGAALLAASPQHPAAAPLHAQPPEHTIWSARPAADTLPLSLGDAVRIALERSYGLRLARLDEAQAAAQVGQARSAVRPQVSGSATFTRNVRSANPFAGAGAGELFGSVTSTEWLAYNERARTDDSEATDPISLGEFRERQRRAYADAGLSLDQEGSFFTVPNQFQGGVSLTQPLFAPAAFAALRAAARQEEVANAAVRRDVVLTADSARRAYAGALLAQRRTAVLERSVAREQATVDEAAQRVAAGVAPVQDRLAAEVELGNVRADLLQAAAQAALARDRLKLTLGLSPEQPVALTDTLAAPAEVAPLPVGLDDALRVAAGQRSDLERARLAVVLAEARLDATQAELLPSVSAFANANYQGQVPDDRTRAVSPAGDPFAVRAETSDPFSARYWSPAVSVGLRLQWSIFGGGAIRARAAQDRLAVRQRRVQYERALAAARVEVEAALRDVREAAARLALQRENVQRAERSYGLAAARVRQGVGLALERREAAGQLDRARLGLAQAAHDYQVAVSALLSAVGLPAGDLAVIQALAR